MIIDVFDQQRSLSQQQQVVDIRVATGHPPMIGAIAPRRPLEKFSGQNRAVRQRTFKVADEQVRDLAELAWCRGSRS